MTENKGVTNLGFLFVGLGIGAGLALLLAPKSGKETRRFLARKAEDGRDYVAHMGKELRKQAEDFVDRGKGWAEGLVQ